jgi:hypothetical protein
MLVIILFLIIGIGLGLSAGKISNLLKMNEPMLTVSIYLLLFMLAVSTRMDELIVRNLDNIGWPVFFIIVITVIGCTIVFSYFYKVFFNKYIRKLFHLF